MVFVMRERDCKPRDSTEKSVETSCARTSSVKDGISNAEKKQMLDKFFGRHFTTLAEAERNNGN